MKRQILLLLMLIFSIECMNAYVFDLIVTKEHKQIQCIILQESDTEVLYHLYGDNSGVTYSMPKDAIQKLYPRTEDEVKEISTTEETTSSIPVQEKDIVILKNGTRIDANIIEINQTDIKFRTPDNPQVIIVRDLNDVACVLYANGEVKMLADYSQHDQPTSSFESREFRDWKNRIDYIHILENVDINKYRTLYIMPIDESNVEYPDKSDNQYEPLCRALYSFPAIIRSSLEKVFPYLNVIIVKKGEEYIDDNALYLNLKIDKLDMGSRALRVWIGFGAGTQTIKISGQVRDTKKEYFDFIHQRLSGNWKTYEKALMAEMNNLSGDIVFIFQQMQSER